MSILSHFDEFENYYPLDKERNMKCPYRKQTTTRNGENSIIYEDFMDCYKEECPFYYKGIGVSVSGTEYEECMKASKEAI